MRLIENLIKFAKETSIHGFVQMANASSSKVKRITWFVLFCSSLIYARYQISDEVKCKYNLIKVMNQFCQSFMLFRSLKIHRFFYTSLST